MVSAKEIVISDLNYICETCNNEFDQLGGKALLMLGGAGSLGYYIIKALVHWNENYSGQNSVKISVVDNFFRGYPNWLRRLEIEKKIEVFEGDITKPITKSIGPYDYIIHAASIASPVMYRKFPLETMDANVNGLRNIFDFINSYEISMKFKISGVLFFSTSEIYGNPSPDNIPTPETYNGDVSCTGPRACYDESKRYGETLCVTFANKYKLPVTIVRPFNNYGPGLTKTDGRVTADFATNIFSNQDIVLLSDGTPTRTFCYIADAVVGYFKVLLKGAFGQPYNIGTKTPEVSMLDLANLCQSKAKNLFNYDGKVIFQRSDDPEYLSDNPLRRCPDISKAEKELGYNPSISLEEGIKRSLIWYHEDYELKG